jgi:hypothetical protein
VTIQSDMIRYQDGSAGDANYGVIGRRYADFRRPDPRIAALIEKALGKAQTVLNVGAGAGSYEPTDRVVTAVEPSSAMRRQRPARLPPAIDAVAEHLSTIPPCSASKMIFQGISNSADGTSGLALFDQNRFSSVR